VDVARSETQALVLCPTRELADQVSRELRALARFVPNFKLSTLCGGIPLRPQLASLVHAPHVVVGTPGRIEELLENGALTFDATRILVLDEADRMLDMGFLPSIERLAARVPPARQTLLFSATLPEAVRATSRALQRDPVEVTIADGEADGAIIEAFIEIDATRRYEACERVLLDARAPSALVFCNTRRDVEDLAGGLAGRGFAALPLHGDLDQREREETLVRFANRSCSVLVATDVAARGLDIEDLPLVVNWELSTDPDVHRHRIGRTGRAGRSGRAVSLVAPGEMSRAHALESGDTRLPWVPLPRLPGSVRAAAAAMQTLRIDAGRQDKLRPGDILGALTGAAGLAGDAVGRITIFPTRSYVAVRREQANQALERLRSGGIKGRKVRVQAV
ncbi:MAG: ATP-dependent RNA helicase DbpA, partial [Dokdonella sp.]|nr:ATP-dependent RNA helicase DbpA [Dokdonella sp.]